MQQQWANAIENIFYTNADNASQLKALNKLEVKLNEQSQELQKMIRNDADTLTRIMMGNLIKVLIYNRDIINGLIENKVVKS